MDKKALSSHKSDPNLVPSADKTDGLSKHIREAFRLGRFSCIPTVRCLVNVVLEMLVTNIVVAATNHTAEM